MAQAERLSGQKTSAAYISISKQSYLIDAVKEWHNLRLSWSRVWRAADQTGRLFLW